LSEQEDTLRAYEQRIDTAHHDLSFWRRPTPHALYEMLATFDSYVVVQEMVNESLAGEDMSVGQVQYFKRLGEGLVQAFQWKHPGIDRHDVVPTEDVAAIDEAAKFLEHAADYFTVALFYRKYWRGLATATVDESIPRRQV
jgi:hypothetical protein